MRVNLILAALLIAGSARAEDACDFEHQCYHMDPSDPNKVTPPPESQYPPIKPIHPLVVIQPRDITIHPTQTCRLMYMKTGPGPAFPPQIVELCSMPEEQEQAIRTHLQQIN